MEYWTLSSGNACRNGWSCRSCKKDISKGHPIIVREGRKLRFHYHKECFEGNGDPRTQKDSTFQLQGKYGKLQQVPPVVKGYGKWSVSSYGYNPAFR